MMLQFTVWYRPGAGKMHRDLMLSDTAHGYEYYNGFYRRVASLPSLLDSQCTA